MMEMVRFKNTLYRLEHREDTVFEIWTQDGESVGLVEFNGPLVEQWEFENTLVSGQKEALELVCEIGDAWRRGRC